MADKKISQLTDGTSLQSGDFVVVARSGDNFKVDPTQFGSDISLGDNVKAIFGAGSDLQIYHDGSNSYIAEGGTGNLQIQGQNLSLEDATGTRFFLGIQGGETRLYNQGNQKVAITATGIDVTGTVTADGLTVENPASGARSVVATLTNTAALSAGAEATIVLKNSGQSAFISGVSTQANSGMDLVFSSNNSSSVETKKITISEDGDISFYEDTGTTPKFFWDASAESLGIGTTSPDGTLHVFAGNNYNGIDFVDAPHALLDNGTVTNHTAVLVFNSSGTDFANKKSGITGGNYYSNNHGLAFFGDISGKDRTATPDVFINDSGKVGIGVTPQQKLHLHDGGTGQIVFAITNATTGSGNNDGLHIGLDVNENALFFNKENTAAIFGTNNTERMRIDDSGNLLVGTTNTAPATNNVEGICLRNEGHINVSRASGVVGYFNRKTDDGTILDFRKDGVGVGSIGSVAGQDIVIGSGSAGLRFLSSGPAIQPRNADGTGNNDAIDLGLSGNRFKDLYLSGGVYLGGTGAANLLDDYETGTFTATLRGASTEPGTLLTVTGSYVKTGDHVFIKVGFESVDNTGYSGQISIEGLPFTNSSGRALIQIAAFNGATWTDSPVGSLATSGTVVFWQDAKSNTSWGTITHNTSATSFFWMTGSYITT